MAIEQNIEFFSDNDVELNFTVTDSDNGGAPKDLTGVQAINWVLCAAPGKPAKVSKALAAGITVTGLPTAGQFKVTIAPADTENIKGTIAYYHEARVTDASGKKVTVTYGAALVREDSI